MFRGADVALAGRIADMDGGVGRVGGSAHTHNIVATGGPPIALISCDGHSATARLLNSLADVFRSRFERVGNVEDIEEAVGLQLRVMELT